MGREGGASNPEKVTARKGEGGDSEGREPKISRFFFSRGKIPSCFPSLEVFSWTLCFGEPGRPGLLGSVEFLKNGIFGGRLKINREFLGASSGGLSGEVRREGLAE